MISENLILLTPDIMQHHFVIDEYSYQNSWNLKYNKYTYTAVFTKDEDKVTIYLSHPYNNFYPVTEDIFLIDNSNFFWLINLKTKAKRSPYFYHEMCIRKNGIYFTYDEDIFFLGFDDLFETKTEIKGAKLFFSKGLLIVNSKKVYLDLKDLPSIVTQEMINIIKCKIKQYPVSLKKVLVHFTNKEEYIFLHNLQRLNSPLIDDQIEQDSENIYLDLTSRQFKKLSIETLSYLKSPLVKNSYVHRILQLLR